MYLVIELKKISNYTSLSHRLRTEASSHEREVLQEGVLLAGREPEHVLLQAAEQRARPRRARKGPVQDGQGDRGALQDTRPIRPGYQVQRETGRSCFILKGIFSLFLEKWGPN